MIWVCGVYWYTESMAGTEGVGVAMGAVLFGIVVFYNIFVVCNLTFGIQDRTHKLLIVNE